MSVIEELKPIIKKSIVNLGPRILKDTKGSINVCYHLRMKILLMMINSEAGRKFETAEEAKQFVLTLSPKDRTKYAYLLLFMDFVSNTIMIIVLMKFLPRELGEKVNSLNMKLAAFIAKRTVSDKKVQENADKLLELAQNQSVALDAIHGDRFSVNKDPNAIKKSLDRAGPFMGNMLLSTGIAAALNEEASKRAALELGFGKEYFIIFNVYEFTQYVINIYRQGSGSMMQSIALRLITVAVHAGLTGLHKIGFHGTATVAHFLHNTFALGIQEIYSMLTNNIAVSTIAQSRAIEFKIKEAEAKWGNEVESKIGNDSPFIQALREAKAKFNV